MTACPRGEPIRPRGLETILFSAMVVVHSLHLCLGGDELLAVCFFPRESKEVGGGVAFGVGVPVDGVIVIIQTLVKVVAFALATSTREASTTPS